MMIQRKIKGIISFPIHRPDGSVTVALSMDEDVKGVAKEQPLRFILARDELNGLPVFTREGKLDVNWLQGLHIAVTLENSENGTYIMRDIELDKDYYQSYPQANANICS